MKPELLKVKNGPRALREEKAHENWKGEESVWRTMATDLRASQYRQKRKALLSFATAEAQAYMIDSGP